VLSSLSCITTEIGVKIVPSGEHKGEFTARLAMHYTDAYLEAARRANTERAQDYQAAGLEIPEELFPMIFQETEELAISPDELAGVEGVEIVEQSDRGFTVVGTRPYTETEGLGDDSGGMILTVIRDDSEWVRYVLEFELQDMTEDIDPTQMDEIRAEGLGPKPSLLTAEEPDDGEPTESEAEDLGQFLVEEFLGMALDAIPDANMELEAWYATRVLLESGLPVMTYWVELPGRIVSYQMGGQTAGTLDPATNRVTLVIDEAFVRTHPEGAGEVWRVESQVHVCDEQCSQKPHEVWDKTSSADACVCECEPGYTRNPTGDGCIEKPSEPPPRFIGNPKNLQEMLKAKGYSTDHCPAGGSVPAGAVILWNRGAGIAHSSVMLKDDRQIEMGHKPGGKRYISEHLGPSVNPEPNRGNYTEAEVLCPPPGHNFDSGGAATMAGTDRNYGEKKPDQWNCHGFSANLVHQYGRTGITIKPGAQYRWEGNRLILEKGEIHIRGNSKVQVEALGGKVIHHSEFVVMARGDGSGQISVLTGDVTFDGAGGAITLQAGEQSEIDAAGGGTPSAPAAFDPNDLEKWWSSAEMVRLEHAEPTVADFNAFELGEIEELAFTETADDRWLGLPMNTVIVGVVGVGICGLLLVVLVGAAWWLFRRRKKRPAALSSVPVRARPTGPPASPFVQAEQRYAQLQQEYQAGRLDAAGFQAAVGELMVQDERGGYWALGGDDGGWHWYDGQKWVRRDPPR